MKREAMRCEAKQENRFLQSKNVSLEKLAVVLAVHQKFLKILANGILHT